jgi:hypothetical protein
MKRCLEHSQVVTTNNFNTLTSLHTLNITVTIGYSDAQADWTFILPSEVPVKKLRHLPRKIPPRDTAYWRSLISLESELQIYRTK